MTKILSQIDGSISSKSLLVLGAIRTYMGRLNFYFGVPNTVMISVLFYNDTAILKVIFPTVYHWVLFVGAIGIPVAILMDRKVLHPAQIAYNSHQASRENRNPVYKEVIEIKRLIEEKE